MQGSCGDAPTQFSPVYLGTKLGVTGGPGEYSNGQESRTLSVASKTVHGATQEPSLSLNLSTLVSPLGGRGRVDEYKHECRTQGFAFLEEIPFQPHHLPQCGEPGLVHLRRKGKPWSEHILFRRLVFPIHRSLPLGMSGLMVN